MLVALAAAVLSYRWSQPTRTEWLDSIVPPVASREAPPSAPDPPAFAPAPEAAAVPVQFAGWCAPPGGGETFTIRRPLPAWVQREARLALEALGDSAAEVVRLGESLRWSRPPAETLAELRALRTADGPDPVVAGVLVAALKMDAREAAQVLAGTEQARALAPEAAAVEVVRSLAARLRGEVKVDETALRRARALAPDDPAIGIATALALDDRPELDEAIAGLRAYLAVDADATPLARLLARLELQRDLHAGFVRRDRDGITLLSPPELHAPDADALLRDVVRDLDDAARLTGSERRPRLLVVVYPEREELLAVSCVQAWTAALYDGVLRVALKSDGSGRLDAEEVRHEALHAQLDTVVAETPRWFEEGLAQYFAGERGPGVQRQWTLMRRNRTYIPFASLTDSFQAFDTGSDAGLAYAQSLAMIEWLVDRAGTAGVARAVAALKADPGADVLSLALGRPAGGEEFLEWLLARR